MESSLESFYRKSVSYNEKDISFQAVEWLEFNEAVDSIESDYDSDAEPDSNYVIKCFGVTSKSESVCMSITGYTPFFYIKVPDNFIVKSFLTNLEDTTGYYFSKAYNPLFKWKKYILKGKCKVFEKKDFYGFCGNKTFKFLRMTFSNSDAMKKTIYLINAHNDHSNKTRIKGVDFDIKLYETNLDSILRFIHIRNLKPTGWLKAKGITVIKSKKSTCQIEVTVPWTSVDYIVNEINAPILQASFDIEVFSVDGTFPSPSVPGNVVTQIATTFKKVSDPNFTLKHIVCLKNCSPLDETDTPTVLETFDTEKQVLLAWKKLMVRMDPDIIFTYNGDTFDCSYLYTRAEFCKCKAEFLSIGKLKSVQGSISEKSFSSSAYGTTNYKRLNIPGRINFDILIFIQREYKENSYKLDSIAEKYLGDKKDPVSVQMIFDYFESGDPDKIKVIASYCVQDASLPQRIVDKLFILEAMISMSNVTYVPFKYLIERGQQIKVFSQILKETRKENFLVPFLKVLDENTKFEGATVLSPLKGVYDLPITVCDFASLYPSIMRAHNICYSSIVLDKKFDNLPGETYETVEWFDKESEKNCHYRYNTTKEGVLPKLLSELTKSRKVFKIKMKEANSPELKEIYNKCQLAVKVSMNSMYGFLAAQTLRCKPMAATVTAIGRKMIDDTKKFVEEKYQSSCAVYGDSVTGDTFILVKDPNTKAVSIKSIKSLYENSISFNGFKYGEPHRKEKSYSTTNYLVWSDKGWVKIKKVIRHYTVKKIYEVSCGSGIVKVTEDHSLLSEGLELIKPCQISPETRLLTSYPSSFDTVECEDEIQTILNSSIEYTRKFLSAFLEKHAYQNGGNYSFDIKRHFAHNIYFLFRKLGYFVRIRKCVSKEKLSFTISEQEFYYDDPVKVEFIGNSTDFVYDLETDSGRFQAGIGEIIVKNTDSVMIDFNTESTRKYKDECDRIYSHTVITEANKKYLDTLKVKCIAESMVLGKEAADSATKTLFKFPISLEYEKVYCPLLLLSKKRYIGKLYSDNPEKYDYQDSKGIVLKRRDNFQLLKNIYQQTLDILTTESKRGIPLVIEKITDVLNDLVQGNTDLDLLIVSKAFKPPYKSKIPHAVLAEKIAERDPGKAPRSNDRIDYLFVDINSKKKEAQYLKVEDPEYVREHNLPLDVEYYITYLMNPMSEILELYMDNPQKIFEDIINKHKRERNKKLHLPPPRETRKEKIERFRDLMELEFGENVEMRNTRMNKYKTCITNTKIIDTLMENE